MRNKFHKLAVISLISAMSCFAANIEIDLKHEINLGNGTYLVKEFGGQRFGIIDHGHGKFESGDVGAAKCTAGFVTSKLPSNYSKVKAILKATDFVFTKCEEDF